MEEEYEYEHLEDIRRSASGGFEVLFKWKGYSKAECTWEPVENIVDLSDRVTLLEDLLEKFNKKKRKPGNKTLVQEAIIVFRAELDARKSVPRTEKPSAPTTNQSPPPPPTQSSNNASQEENKKNFIIPEDMTNSSAPLNDKRTSQSQAGTSKAREKPTLLGKESPIKPSSNSRKPPIVSQGKNTPTQRTLFDFVKPSTGEQNSQSQDLFEISKLGKQADPKEILIPLIFDSDPKQRRSKSGIQTPKNGAKSPITPRSLTPKKPSTPTRFDHFEKDTSGKKTPAKGKPKTPTRGKQGLGSEHLTFFDKFLLGGQKDTGQDEKKKSQEKIISESQDSSQTHSKTKDPRREIPKIPEIIPSKKEIAKMMNQRGNVSPALSFSLSKSKPVTPRSRTPAKGLTPVVSGKQTPVREKPSQNKKDKLGKASPIKQNITTRKQNELASTTTGSPLNQKQNYIRQEKDNKIQRRFTREDQKEQSIVNSPSSQKQSTSTPIQKPAFMTNTAWPTANPSGSEGFLSSLEHQKNNHPPPRFYLRPCQEFLLELAQSQDDLLGVELPEVPVYCFDKDDGVPQVFVQGSWYSLEQVWRHDPNRAFSYANHIMEDHTKILKEYYEIFSEIEEKVQIQMNRIN